MKKKVIALAVIAANLLLNNVYAEKIGYTQDKNGEVTVIAEEFEENSTLSFTVYSEITSGGERKKYIKQIDEKKADSSGKAEFKFNFFESDPSAVYIVSIQDETMIDSAETVEIEFKNELAINLVNNAKDSAELLKVLKEYGVSLNIDSKMLEDMDEKLAAEKIFNKKSTYDSENFEKFRELYYETCITVMIKQSQGDKIEELLEKYSGVINVSKDSDYDKLSDTAKLSLCGKIAGKEFTDLEDLQNEWKEQTGLEIISSVKYPALYSWITNGESVGLKENYEEILGLDKNSQYEKLVDKKAPYQKLAGNTYNSKENAQKAFAAACEEQYKKENPTTIGGGSGNKGNGGTGSGSGTGMPAVFGEEKMSNESSIPEKSRYYNDISEYKWAEEAINSLTDKKILSGTGDGRYKPQNNVTREEFLKMLIASLDLPMIKSDIKFKDVDENAWFYEYVSTGVEVGIISGIGENLFGSGQPITRADMAVMLERTSKISGIELKANADYIEFADNTEIPEYAKSSVEKVQMASIINGYTDKTFKPSKTATRAESAVVIYKMLNLR